MEDTLTLARLEREKQGPWEAEVSYGGEADLHRHLIICNKNPGHQKFVPVDQFNVDHLPTGCRDNDIVDYVRAMSDLTVRVSVKYVSDRRPETVPGSGKPYPSYKDRGSDMMRTGTGWVWRVGKYTNMDNSSTICECQECLNSPTSKTQFAHIHIQTASHVVYDELEAAHTTCHLFFDKGDSPDKCIGVRALSGWSVVGKWSNVVNDWCDMVHVTHDLELADRLYKMVPHWHNLLENLTKKYDKQESSSPSVYLPEALNKQESSSPSVYLPETLNKQESSSPSVYLPETLNKQESSSPSVRMPKALNKLTIIVSHPHGCSKHVSVGYHTGSGGAGYPIRARYTTATCPGTSGARVTVMGEDGVLWFYSLGIIHCGGNENLNYSSAAYQVTLELFLFAGGHCKKVHKKNPELMQPDC